MPSYAPDMPAKLAESAHELFSCHGFKQVSLDAIASHVGVTKGSLYWHYRSKKAIVEAACAHYYQSWQRRVRNEIANVADPIERLERAVRFCVRSCLVDKKNRVFTTEIFALSLYDAEVRRGWAQFYNTSREFYIALVDAAKNAGQLDTSDSECAVDLMLEAAEGIKMRALFEPHILLEEERIFEELMSVLKR